MEQIVKKASEMKEWESTVRRQMSSMEAELDAKTDLKRKDGLHKIDAEDENSVGATKSSSLWIYLYRCAKLGSRSVWKKKKNIALEEQIRSLCDEIIKYKLITEGFDKKRCPSSNQRPNAS